MYKKKKIASRFASHARKMGFTNRLAIYLVTVLSAGLAGGFFLANKSIDAGFTGALACWTVVFTPIGTALSIVLAKVVDKSKAENSEGGIVFEASKAMGFQEPEFKDSPEI